MMPNMVKTIIGDCDCCTNTNVELTPSHGMNQCADCRAKEQAAITVKNIIEESRVVDTSINIKTDIFLARTVAAVELRAAIEHDDTIPADQKDYRFAQESLLRFKHLQKVIFEERAALLEKENEQRMWQAQAQNTAIKLRAEQRAEFKELDFNYQPAGITKKEKTVKPAKPGTKSFNKQELVEACKKYKVTEHSALIRMMMVSRNMSADMAAKEFADKLGIK